MADPILVTGASGFVGVNVVAALRDRGLEPVLTSTSSGIAVDLDEVQDAAAFRQHFGPIRSVVHLAWGGLPNYRSTHHFEEELPRSYRFLRAAVDAGVESLVVAGTCFEYGEVAGQIDEDHPCAPTNAYGFAKHSLHHQLQYLRETSPFRLTWARLFYLFGDGQNPRSLYPSLRSTVATGDSSFPMSGGEQIRDFVSIGAAADAIAFLAQAQADVGAVNICSGTPVSVRAQVERWLLEMGAEIQLELGSMPYSDLEPFAFWGDATKLRSLVAPDPVPATTKSKG